MREAQLTHSEVEKVLHNERAAAEQREAAMQARARPGEALGPAAAPAVPGAPCIEPRSQPLSAAGSPVRPVGLSGGRIGDPSLNAF